jgi:hypothetical protein
MPLAPEAFQPSQSCVLAGALGPNYTQTDALSNVWSCSWFQTPVPPSRTYLSANK